MCSPVLRSHWAVTFLDVPWCLSVSGLLSRESSAQRQAVCSATPLTGEQWSLDLGFHGSPPPPLFTKRHIHVHPYSQPPASCHIRLPKLPLLPGLIVTQLGMGDQASWEGARAWIMAALSLTKRDQQPIWKQSYCSYEHRFLRDTDNKSVKNNKMAQKEASRELTKKTKENMFLL